MSELIHTNDNRTTIRWKLLTSASALALAVSSISMARADDADHPQIWIELGGQAENISGQGEAFAPAFFSAYPTSSILLQKVTPLQAQQPPKFSFGEDGRISFEPDGSDWVFSGAIRYGRSSNTRHVNHQTTKVHHTQYISGVPLSQLHPSQHYQIFTQEKFVDSHITQKASHAVLDFTAGKDVGLGMFGNGGSSILSLGVRIAQFTSHSSDDIRARPDLRFQVFPSSASPNRKYTGAYFHTYHASERASRSFRGLGPSVSWTGSAPFVGNQQDGELTFDWGANAALLFGKQKARVGHQQTGRYWTRSAATNHNIQVLTPTAGGRSASRSVTVPNVGGSVGLSWRVQDFKVSMGYRADFFFGAMDTGIDAVKKSTLSFNGPYASISVGLGD